MSTTDEASDRPRSGGDSNGCHVYRTDRAVRGDDRLRGEVDGERFRAVLLRHPDACEAFRMIPGTGYRDPAESMGTYAAAEHAGRIKTDVESIAADAGGEGNACVVRLDTADPQLATIRDGVERAQVEFDTARVRWVAPESVESAGD